MAAPNRNKNIKKMIDADLDFIRKEGYGCNIIWLVFVLPVDISLVRESLTRIKALS